jgi:hypothetical protein
MKFAAESIDERFVTLTREQAARALGISTDTLDALHARDEGPPRFRASPRRWAYPAGGVQALATAARRRCVTRARPTHPPMVRRAGEAA